MKKRKAFNCPLCEDIVLCIKVRKTYIYNCLTCPFIAIEFYDDSDSEMLVAYLSEKKPRRDIILEQFAWVKENYPSSNEIHNDCGMSFIFTEDETGIKKVFLPDDLQLD